MTDESKKTHSPIKPTCTGRKTIPAPIAIPILIMTQPVSMLSNLIASRHSLSVIPARRAGALASSTTLLFVAVSIKFSLIM